MASRPNERQLNRVLEKVRELHGMPRLGTEEKEIGKRRALRKEAARKVKESRR